MQKGVSQQHPIPPASVSPKPSLTRLHPTSYHESLSTLYATNTLIMESWPSTLALLRLAAAAVSTTPSSPRVLSPGQHLTTSLCLRTTFSLWWYGETQLGDGEDGAALVEYAALLPRAFPRLRSLVWSVGENLSVPRIVPDMMMSGSSVVPSREKLERGLLAPLLEMRRKVGEIEEMVVAVPVGVFFVMAEEAWKAGQGGVVGEREEEEHLARLWYPFEGASPGGQGEGGEGEHGFWIGLGSDIWDGEGRLHGVVTAWKRETQRRRHREGGGLGYNTVNP